MQFAFLALLFLLLDPSLGHAAHIDLHSAVVVSPESLSRSEAKAIQLLIEEVEARTQIRWRQIQEWPAATNPVIAVGPVSLLGEFAGKFAHKFSDAHEGRDAEGYRIHVETGPQSSAVFVIGNDSRGVLFGVGRLLRTLRMSPGAVSLPDDIDIATAPRFPLRGHQLGYRPKTNSYDGWTVPMWEQYIRDLAVFGANAIELIPPRSDDAADSPHFPAPQMEMMMEMSRIIDEYGLDVWIWYPALDDDYTDPKTVQSALKEWSEVFRKLPRIDAVFVPGGDPGHTPPRILMSLLEKQAQNLRRYHPQAQMWVAPQSFSTEWLNEFWDILRAEPEWLSGVVFGPQVRISLRELRAKVPNKYPIRRYPDITHSRHSQYPVPDWDLAYAVTEGREIINPRPSDQARIFRLLQDYAIGFITYSEGCNDDINKVVWSSLGWNPEKEVIEILREYGRYFIGDRYGDDFAHGLLALERNWRGPLLTNEGVENTLKVFQAMESSASPRDLLNWRFQHALYRAHYDAYTRNRLIYETTLEKRAMSHLRQALDTGSLVAMSQAENILDRAITEPVSQDWRARVFELAEALYQSVRMQLSVERYQAIATERGANLDTIDIPLNNRLWLKARFGEIRNLDEEEGRLKQIDEIVNWTSPGPGGFYDDLGNLMGQPHLVRGPGFDQDPAHLESSLVGFAARGNFLREPIARSPISWWRHAETLNDTPLRMRYHGLDPQARYKLRVVYAGDTVRPKIRLEADQFTIHPLMERPIPFRPIEFEIPLDATADGELNLIWHREPGLGGNGQGLQIAEVWLIKQ